MRLHWIATAIAASALVLTATCSPAPAAQASAGHRKVTVGETLFRHHKYHKLRATYAVRPSAIALLEPGRGEIVALRWSIWSSTRAKGNGALQDAGGCCGVPVRVQLSRVRSDHFTRMLVFSNTGSHASRVFRWLGTSTARSPKTWWRRKA